MERRITTKSYTTNFEENKDFINSFDYDEDRNLIVINYASGEKLPALCNRENLIKILEKMKQQVINSEVFEEKQKRKFKLSLIMSVLAAFMLLITFFMPSFLLLLTSIATLYIGLNNMLNSQKMIDDIKKNKFFLENSDDVNRAVKNLTSEEISNMIDCFSLKDTTIFEDKLFYMNTEDVPIINLNSIDNLSLESTKKIVESYTLKPKKKNK